MKKVATIAGSDATGGGGLEADLKPLKNLVPLVWRRSLRLLPWNQKLGRIIYAPFH